MIRVLVNGALGRMGGEVCKKVFAEPDLELVGAVDIKEGDRKSTRLNSSHWS